MGEYLFAEANGRKIPLEDKIFGITRQAKEMIAEKGKDAVIMATIGSLLDDDGKLAVLSSVVKELRELAPVDYADYAPIGGFPAYREAVKKAAFGSYVPKRFTEAVATPGGTGAIRNTISNFSKPGHKILVADWYWGPYSTIAQEIGRTVATFRLFNEQGQFDAVDFAEKVEALTAEQGSLVVILNTPAHNPTGYSLTEDDWQHVTAAVKKAAGSDRKITILVDVAYIEFAKDPAAARVFLPIVDDLPENVLPIIGYSFSKTFTMYGMRCGAMICMAASREIADEFKRVCEFSSRGTWSNCTAAPQKVVARVFGDSALLAKVEEEREGFRAMLAARGKAFEEEAKKVGLEIVPFDAGFFASIPCEDPDAIGKKLQQEGIFLVPLAKGLRVSVASIPEAQCRYIPARVKAAMEK